MKRKVMDQEKTVHVEIPESLHKRVAEQVKKTPFRSVSEYIAHAVREKLMRDEDQAPTTYTKEEEDRIKERLKQLGYL